MTSTYIKSEIKRLQKEIDGLRYRQKIQADEFEYKINQIKGKIINYQKALHGKED